jgi:elongation factor G
MTKPRKDHFAFDLTSAPAKPPTQIKQTPRGDALAHRETVTKAASGDGRFVRQSDVRGQYGHVMVEIMPNLKSGGIKVTCEASEGAIPSRFVSSATEGVREGLQNGVVAGFPVIDVVARIVGGSYHEVDSSEIAFKMAGIFAIKDALKKAGPVLLE